MTNLTDLYAQMLEVKSGTRGWVGVSKKAMRAACIEWAFVENSASILGLVLKPHGKHGYPVSKF